MNDAVLRDIRDLIQEDVGSRGLATDPDGNLINACPDDFAAACRSIAETPKPALVRRHRLLHRRRRSAGGETDGPLGALFLARALAPLGIEVALATDAFCGPALQAGLAACGLGRAVPLVSLRLAVGPLHVPGHWQSPRLHELTHLIALERVGPSHTLQSLRAQPGCSRSRGASSE